MDREAALETIKQFNIRIFWPGFKEETGAFRPPQERRERAARLWEKHVDTHPEWIIFFNEHDDPIGWFYGYMEDEETFFIDTIGLVPEFRKKGLYQAFLRKLILYLKAVGYERLTSSHHWVWLDQDRARRARGRCSRSPDAAAGPEGRGTRAHRTARIFRIPAATC